MILAWYKQATRFTRDVVVNLHVNERHVQRGNNWTPTK